MDVSNRPVRNNEAGGQELISSVISLTGLPEPLIEKELSDIIHTSGHAPADLTLEQLRAAMVAYLECIHEDMNDGSLDGNEIGFDLPSGSQA